MRRIWTAGEPGERLEFTIGDECRIACCDCGLVHTLIVHGTEKGVARISFKRDNRTTGQFRRYRKYPFWRP